MRSGPAALFLLYSNISVQNKQWSVCRFLVFFLVYFRQIGEFSPKSGFPFPSGTPVPDVPGRVARPSFLFTERIVLPVFAAFFAILSHLPAFSANADSKKAMTDARIRTFPHGFLSGRSGETRTRGLLLPKQARYQLRNTPATDGTAAPPEYSISFFLSFVNIETAPVPQLKERKPLPMISLELTMVMKLWGSFSRRKLRSCSA